MIDAKTIEELQGLLAKATPGPWFMIEKDGRFLFEIMSSSVYVAETSWHDASPIFPTKEGSKANFDLIVAMRNALPALLDLASKTLASAREGEDSPAGILDVQRMLTIHQPTGWLAHDIAIASARLQPQVSASGGEDVELCGRLEEHATDWDGRQMPDLEPAKGDPTAGTLRAAVTRIRALASENERLRRERDEARIEYGHMGDDYRELEIKLRNTFADVQSMKQRVHAAEAEADALRERMVKADRLLIKCFNRIHPLPRVSDTELADAIAHFRARSELEGRDNG